MFLIAMDFKTTNRAYDADGRLRVTSSNISKGNVCPYLGREIPSWQMLNLDPDRIYNLFRDPVELERAAETFNNLPILSEHVPVTVDDHRPDLVVGSTGTDALMNGTYLTNSLVVWARDAIRGIEQDVKRQLSSAYRYRADMTPGEFEGVAYDGVMRDIVGNHVALVFEGRAGSDVIVGDEKPMAIKSRRALLVAGSLSSALRPMLAQDAKFDISAALTGVTADTLAKPGASLALAEKVVGLVQPHLAQDAKLDVPVLLTAIETANSLAMDERDDLLPVAEDEDDDKDKVTEDADADPDDDIAQDEDGDDDKPAMDEATVNAKIAKAVKAERAAGVAIRTAEKEVADVIGDLPAMDSAAAVYRAGLKALNVDYSGVPSEGLGALFRASKAAVNAAPALAQDSRLAASARSDFNQRYPKRATLIRG